MIRVSFMGYLGADPEARFTQQGVELVNFRVAVSQRRRKPGSDEWEDAPSCWFSVRVGGPRVAFAKSLAKGSRVLVFGRMEQREYQTRDGETRTSLDVYADELQNLSPRESNDRRSASGEDEAGPPARAGQPARNAASSELEDLPF